MCRMLCSEGGKFSEASDALQKLTRDLLLEKTSIFSAVEKSYPLGHLDTQFQNDTGFQGASVSQNLLPGYQAMLF